MAALPFVWARLFVGRDGIPEAFRYGSSEVGVPLADAIAPWLIPLTGIGLLLLVLARALGRLDHAPVADIAFVAILWLTVTSRVLSPQYNVWLVGMAALVWAAGSRRMRTATIPVAVTAIAAQVLYPFSYIDIVDGGFIGVAVQTVRIARAAHGHGAGGPRAPAREARPGRCRGGHRARVDPGPGRDSDPGRLSTYPPARNPILEDLVNHTRALAALAVAGLALTACSPASDTATEPSASASGASCDKATLQTKTPGKLVIATGEPAYEPWVVDDAPESGEGFEAAVAYAAAEKLGYDAADVQWVRSTFDSAIAPGAKDFDWNLQQFTITEDREKAVDFSSPYYEAPQAIITYPGSPIADAKSLADLESAKLGAAVGSTSLDAAQELATGEEVAVFNDNAAAVSALKNEQIDGIVVDLPTAYYLVDVEIEDGVIVGQLPVGRGGSLRHPHGQGQPADACTTQAVDAAARGRDAR